MLPYLDNHHLCSHIIDLHLLHSVNAQTFEEKECKNIHLPSFCFTRSDMSF